MGNQDISLREMREKLTRDLLVIFVVLGLPIGLASASRTFADGDTSWHLAVGQWIIQHGYIPTTDVFSYTAYGKPWVSMEWPADLLFAGTYDLAGYAGLAAIVAAAIMALNAIVLLYLRTRVGGLGLGLAILSMDIVLSTFMLARPHVLVWPVLAGWTILLAKSTETGRPPPLWSALLLTIWTNLHGSFPLAAIIGGFLALDALIIAEWKTLRQWLLFAAVCFVAICLNLNGLDGLLQPIRIAQLESLQLIGEWQPTVPSFAPQFYAAFLLVLAILFWRGVRVPVGRLLLLLTMLFMAFSQQRHQSWFAIVAAILLPPLLGQKREAQGKVWPILAAAIPLLLARAFWPLTPPETVSNPRNLLAHIPTELRAEPVFNEYSFGGPLIRAGIRPYIDGRSELYGDAFMTDYVDIMRHGDLDRFDRAVKRYNIRWTIMPTAADLVSVLDHSPGWRRVYSDEVGVIHVRTGAPSATAARLGTGATSRPAVALAPPRA